MDSGKPSSAEAFGLRDKEEELRNRVVDYLNANTMTRKELARTIGFNYTGVVNFLSGYKGLTPNLYLKLVDFLNDRGADDGTHVTVAASISRNVPLITDRDVYDHADDFLLTIKRFAKSSVNSVSFPDVKRDDFAVEFTEDSICGTVRAGGILLCHPVEEFSNGDSVVVFLRERKAVVGIFAERKDGIAVFLNGKPGQPLFIPRGKQGNDMVYAMFMPVHVLNAIAFDEATMEAAAEWSDGR